MQRNRMAANPTRTQLDRLKWGRARTNGRDSGLLEQIGQPELARLPVFQRRFLRLQVTVGQRLLHRSANPVTSNVTSLSTDMETLHGHKPDVVGIDVAAGD